MNLRESTYRQDEFTRKYTSFWLSRVTWEMMGRKVWPLRYTCCAWAGGIFFPLSYKSFSSPSMLRGCMVHSARIWLVIHINNKWWSTNFLLNPNFLLIHRNRYSEEMDNGQKTPRRHPDFNSYVKILCVFIENGQTNRQTDSRMDGDINLLHVGWRRNLFSSCAVVSVFGSGGK